MTTFLLPIAPKGMFTSNVESLDSYVRRLAFGHGVSVYAFFKVLREWWRGQLREGDESLGFYVRYNYTSGYGRDIECLIKVLEAATGYKYLAPLSLRAFSRVSGKHVGLVLRSAHYWCPGCMLEWRNASQEPYEKLLWRLKPISRCPIHKLKLQCRCPACDELQTRLVDQSWFRCSSCATNLLAGNKNWEYVRFAPPGERDLVNAIRYAAMHPDHIFFEHAPLEFFRLVKKERVVGRFSKSAGDYFHKRSRPKPILIGSLLRAAQYLNAPMVDMLLDPKLAASIQTLPNIEPLGLKRQSRTAHFYNLADRELVFEELQISLAQGLAGKSTSQISHELGISWTTMRAWHPELMEKCLVSKRALLEEVQRSQRKRLREVTKEMLFASEFEDVSWHRIVEIVAERCHVSIFAARKRVQELREYR